MDSNVFLIFLQKTPCSHLVFSFRYYTCRQPTTCSVRVPNGTITFRVDTPGDYALWYLDNDGYSLIAGPVAFSVTRNDAGTCNNLLHNGDETGVDCGGSCSPCGHALSLPGLNATTYAIVQPWHWPQSFTVEARVFFPSGRVSTVLSYAAGTSYNCLMAVPSKVVNE